MGISIKVDNSMLNRNKYHQAFWELTVLNIQMKGKALFFKTIAVQQKMLRISFRRVSDDLTLAKAADILHESPPRATTPQLP